MVNEKVYKKLIEVAKNKKIITYSELNLACKLGINFEGDAGGKEIGEILGDISKREFKNGRPLISAIVTLKDSHPPYPGEGFFNLADELGLRPKGETKEIFFVKELRRVYDYWDK